MTAFAAHPVYDSGGEIPVTLRGAGFETSDGFRSRTPWTRPVNAGVSYNAKVGGRSLLLIADVFNAFNDMVTTLRSRQAEEISQLDAALATASTHGVSDRDLQPFRALRDRMQSQLD